MTTTEKGTDMRVPPSPDGTTPSERTPEPARGGPWTSHGHPIAGLTTVGPGRPSVARCGGPRMCNKCATEQAGLMEAARIDDDRDETITDRAAIRDSDEPSERGDFPYYDLGPATSETVGALDLDALHETICDNFTGMAEVRQAADALVAEVRSLRAQVAAVEAKRDEFADLVGRALPAIAALGAAEEVGDRWYGYGHGPDSIHDSASLPCGACDVLAEFRAALATTGEGK